MARNPNQKLKLLYLMQILQQHTDNDHGMTIAELLRELERYNVTAERKSLYDDMEALRSYGLDVQRTGHRYYLLSHTFELAELKLLVDAIQSSRFLTHKKSQELIKKLEGLTSIHQARMLQRQVYVTNRIKTMNESIYYNIDKLHNAISTNRRISFRYFSWSIRFDGGEQVQKRYRHEGNRYSASPWALCWDNENYYLIAYDSEDKQTKHYRVDKMSDIQLSKSPREGQELFERFDMGSYAKGVFGMFSGQEEQVRLRFHNDLANVVVDRFGKDVFVQPDEDRNHFIAVVRVQLSPQFLGWIFALGDGAEILSPESARQALREQAGKVLASYDPVTAQ